LVIEISKVPNGTWPISCPVKMIVCPSDTLANVHNISVRYVIFPCSESENVKFKVQSYRIISCHAFKLTPVFHCFKAVACVLSIFLKNMTDARKRMASSFYSPS